MSSLSSSETMCQLNECAQPMGPTPRSKPTELQNLHKNLAASLTHKMHNVNWLTLWYGWHGSEQRIIDNATDEWCKCLWVCVYVKRRLLVNITSKFMLSCWIGIYIRLSQFLIFYVSQGGYTGKMHWGKWQVFITNSLLNPMVKKIWK